MMKIIFLIFVVYLVRCCFLLIGENLHSFVWIFPLLLILAVIMGLLSLKILSEFLESY
jgi:hypothetical protein